MDEFADIRRALKTLGDRETAYADAVMAAAKMDAAYRIAKAEAYLRADGTIQDRENEAIKQCKDLLMAREKAIAERDIIRELLLNVRAALSARQSILSASIKVHEVSKHLTP